MAKKNSNLFLLLGAGAVAYFLFKKHQDDSLAPVVSPMPYPDNSTVTPGNPISTLPPVVTVAPPPVPKTGPATFNLVNNEQTNPFFIDGNLQFKINGQVVNDGDLWTQGSKSFSVNPGGVYTIEAYCQESPAGSGGAMWLLGARDEGVIYNRAISAMPGASLVKTGVVKPGAVYNFLLRTTSALDSSLVSNVDVDDNAISGFDDYEDYYIMDSPAMVVLIDGIVY